MTMGLRYNYHSTIAQHAPEAYWCSARDTDAESGVAGVQDPQLKNATGIVGFGRQGTIRS